MSRFRDYIDERDFDKHFIMAHLTYESATGNPRARSPTGPKGLPQFTSAIAKHYNLKINGVIKCLSKSLSSI
jgi:membrane-bound lytic murein transglycosylase MltF